MTVALKLGTRGSPLAVAQAQMTAAALEAAHGVTVEIVTIVTTGDRVQDRPLAEIGGKALWTKELDAALLDGRIDIAVHSMKDVETRLASGIVIAAMLPRADVRDRLIGAGSLEALRQNATIGTSSPRRAAQLRALRPDVQVTMFRGNVATRLAKLEAGEVDATLLAAAGLDRLGIDVGHAVSLDQMLPAPSQGAVGITARADDHTTLALLGAVDDAATSACVRLERGFLCSPRCGLPQLGCRTGGARRRRNPVSCRDPVARRQRAAIRSLYDLHGGRGRRRRCPCRPAARRRQPGAAGAVRTPLSRCACWSPALPT